MEDSDRKADSAIPEEVIAQQEAEKPLDVHADMVPLQDLWGAPGGAKPMATEYTEQLPSRGVLYKDPESGDPLLPGGHIRLRPLTTREEGILYGQADAVEKMHKMVSACIVDKTIDPADLLVIDQFFILLSLRVHSFGAEYDIPIRCQYCREQAKVKLNLVEAFSVQYMSEAAMEPFYVDLPVSGKRLGIRLQRVRDQFRLRQHTKRTRMQTVDAGDPSHVYRLALAIKEIAHHADEDGKPVMLDIKSHEAEQFVHQMHMADSNFLQNEINRIEGGVDTRIYPECPACGASNEMRMPFELEFFRPGAV